MFFKGPPSPPPLYFGLELHKALGFLGFHVLECPKQQCWLFKLTDTVNMGKFGQLWHVLYLIPDIAQIQRAVKVYVDVAACPADHPTSSLKSDK